MDVPGGRKDDLSFSQDTRILLDAIGETTRKTIELLHRPTDPRLASDLATSVERLNAVAVTAGVGPLRVLR